VLVLNSYEFAGVDRRSASKTDNDIGFKRIADLYAVADTFHIWIGMDIRKDLNV
jgi:hypothetical protein